MFTNETDEVHSDADELVEAVRHAQTRTIYRMDDISHTPLSGTVVLAAAFVRRQRGAGHSYDRHFWLCEVRDGRLYRSEAFRREQHALAAFADGWAAGAAEPTAS